TLVPWGSRAILIRAGRGTARPADGLAAEVLSETGRKVAMQVRELMTRDVQVCGPRDDLNRAAQIMWDHDCGVVPVVDSERRPIGMVTDRDVCMAAYTQGKPLSAIRAEEV